MDASARRGPGQLLPPQRPRADQGTDTCCLNTAPPHTKLHVVKNYIQHAITFTQQVKKGQTARAAFVRPCKQSHERPSPQRPAAPPRAHVRPTERPHVRPTSAPPSASPCSEKPAAPSLTDFPQAPISKYWAVPQAITLPAQHP